MKTIINRVEKAEVRVRRNQPAMSIDQISARIDELLAKAGTTREEIIEKFGSLERFTVAFRKRMQNETGRELPSTICRASLRTSR